jgi:hypothetical protein
MKLHGDQSTKISIIVVKLQKQQKLHCPPTKKIVDNKIQLVVPRFTKYHHAVSSENGSKISNIVLKLKGPQKSNCPLYTKHC